MNSIALCYDYVGGLPELARGNLGSLLSSSSVQAGDSELEQIFPIDKAVVMINRGVPHRLDKKVRHLLDVVQKVQAENKDLPEDALKKMEEALQKKIELSKQLNDFESKQSWMFVGVFLLIGVWILIFICCYRRKVRNSQQEATADANASSDDKALDKRIEKISKMLELMHEEEIKLRKQLDDLRSQNQSK